MTKYPTYRWYDFDHVIRQQIKNIIAQLSRRLQLLNIMVTNIIETLPFLQVGMHTKIKGCHSFISRDLIMLK